MTIIISIKPTENVSFEERELHSSCLGEITLFCQRKRERKISHFSVISLLEKNKTCFSFSRKSDDLVGNLDSIVNTQTFHFSVLNLYFVSHKLEKSF